MARMLPGQVLLPLHPHTAEALEFLQMVDTPKRRSKAAALRHAMELACAHYGADMHTYTTEELSDVLDFEGDRSRGRRPVMGYCNFRKWKRNSDDTWTKEN